MKVRRFLIAQTLLCAAAILTGCARSLGDDVTAENSNVDGTEWWDVTRENMDEEETTEPVTTAKTEVTEETTTETTNVTDENGNPSGGGGGKGGRGNSGKTKDCITRTRQRRRKSSHLMWKFSASGMSRMQWHCPVSM